MELGMAARLDGRRSRATAADEQRDCSPGDLTERDGRSVAVRSQEWMHVAMRALQSCEGWACSFAWPPELLGHRTRTRDSFPQSTLGVCPKCLASIGCDVSRGLRAAASAMSYSRWKAIPMSFRFRDLGRVNARTVQHRRPHTLPGSEIRLAELQQLWSSHNAVGDAGGRSGYIASMWEQQRLMHRQGSVIMRGGVPFSNPATTLSLLPGAAIGRFLHGHRDKVRGRLLDLGCGNQPYRQWYEPLAARRVTLDAAPLRGVTVQGVADRLPFASGAFDTILATEVLEHVEDAEMAANEIARVLRPGGFVLATVPFLYPTHEAPYDNRRFTHYGLRSLFERRGFDVVGLESKGGIPSVVAQFLVMMSVECLRAIGRRSGWKGLVSGSGVRWLLGTPQQIAIRTQRPRRDFAGGAKWMSLGYMIVARRCD